MTDKDQNNRGEKGDGTRYLDYATPADIVMDDGLDDARKRKLLEDWKMDLDSRLYAEAEGMSNSEPISSGKEASLSEREQLVSEALAMLGDRKNAEKS